MNNKKRNRKGFTIVELSIVIAVIAILAAAMIPVFGNIVGNSRKATAARNAQTIYTNYVNNFVTTSDDGEYAADCWVVVNVDGKDYYVEIENGGVVENSATTTAPTSCYKKLADNAVNWVKVNSCATGDTCENKANH